jgi:hypothetical protein
MQNETLDGYAKTDHQPELSISNGRSFDSKIVFAAVVAIILSIPMLISGGPGYVIGPVLFFGGLFVLTSSYGTDMSFTTNYARQYNKLFGFKSGKWLPISAFTDIVILKISRSQKASDITGAVSTDIDISKNEVYLMTYDHRKRFLLKVCKSYQEALQFSEEMSKKLDKKVAVFNPQVSEKTKQRLQRRR